MVKYFELTEIPNGTNVLVKIIVLVSHISLKIIFALNFYISQGYKPIEFEDSILKIHFIIVFMHCYNFILTLFLVLFLHLLYNCVCV